MSTVWADDDETVQLAARIPKRLHRAAREDAIASDVTLSVWITEALEAHLERTKPSKPRRGTDE